MWPPSAGYTVSFWLNAAVYDPNATIYLLRITSIIKGRQEVEFVLKGGMFQLRLAHEKAVYDFRMPFVEPGRWYHVALSQSKSRVGKV